MGPTLYHCNVAGSLLGSLLSFKTIVKFLVFAAIVYFGWPILEPLLVIVIPDPDSLKMKANFLKE